MLPWSYRARWQGEAGWSEEYLEKPHKTPEEERALPDGERAELLASRNSFPDLPLVNYTTQYGMGCFEGLKAFPRPDGSIRIFRPDENGKRLARSMEGLRMPAFPSQQFVEGVRGTVRRNHDIGFTVPYDSEWEKHDFLYGHSIYLRPFTYSEPGIGLGLSVEPWVIIVATPVGAYFDPDASSKAITTDKVRATPGGTGWIKCDANYVIPTLEKKRVQDNGFMECIFLDAATKTFVEEGSSCNIFFYMAGGTLVTPSLEDTILPGINRKSVITLAQDMGVPVEERRVSIDEVMTDAREVFVTGTAAGVAHIESVAHQGREAVFADRKIGDLSRALRKKLKGIQYGAEEDVHGWMFEPG